MAFLGGASSSSTPSWIYDVFLSFYGEDTRNGFTDHLYAALKQKGLITFRDDEKLEQGKDISQELLKAIQKSQYAIVIISKRYAFSKWCLMELTKILECRTKTGMTVLPVFYYVDPSHVQKQKGGFAEAFAKHNENTEVDEEQKKMWRAALKDIGNLSGWHIDNRPEVAIIENISRKILDGVNHMSSNIFEGLVGIGSQASELMSLLSIGSNGVCFIGICGMGGIGKTTLAKAVYNRVSSHFEASSFVAHVREETRIKDLQTQLVCEILQEKGLNVWNTHRGIDIMKRRMRNRNILIVLDNLDTEQQLKALLGSHDWFGERSRVIVTSRDRHLLSRYVDKIYEMRELSEVESLELFSWNAFKEDYPKEGYVKLSKDIVCFAQGLPLAIEVFGAYLFGKTMDEWKSAQEQLKTNLKTDILDILKISFDGLENSQKELFLDIACLFDENYFWDYNILKCLHNHFAIDIKVLQDRCLVKKFYAKYHMHNLLKKMGQEIVYRECPTNPGRRGLQHYEDIKNVLNYNIGTDKIEAIDLDLSFHRQEQLNLEGFSKLKRLRMLVIRNSQSYYGFHALEWCGDLSNFMLSNELRYLEWVGYPLENLPINFQANQLVKLKMPYSCIKQLSGWKNFHNIKFINMSYSCILIEIPDVNGMPNLVELDFQYCRSLSTVHSSLGNLKQLKKLEMEGCDRLNKLPDEISLESLEYLNLAGCLRLEKFPNISGNMKTLEFLDLIGIAIKELPLSFEGLSSLKYLNLCGSMSYRRLVNDRFCKDPVVLEYEPSRRSNHCIRMDRINGGGSGSNPSSCLHFLNVFSGLSSLKRLDISYRNLSDVAIPHELCYLSSLKYLYLCGNKLTTIPSNIYLLPKLRFLYLRSCTSLKTLLKPSFSRLSCLKELHLGYCKMVDGVIPNDLSCFSSLKLLDLRDNKFRRLPDLIQLSQLRDLCLDDCTELEALPKLPLSLKSLLIRRCVSLKILWVEMDRGLKSNCAIGVVGFDYDGSCTSLKTLLKPSFSRLSCLEELRLGHCKMVDGVIPNDLSCFSSLQRLHLCDNKFRRLPDLIQLSQLRDLCLKDCTELEALPKLPLSLKCLWIRGCISLKILWVEMDGGLKSNCAIGVVGFNYDGRPHQILQLPSYPRICLSSDEDWEVKWVNIVALASTSKISEWFNRRITSSFRTIESCFQVSWPSWPGKYWGGFALLILYQLKADTFQEKRKKQKVDECGKSNYRIFDGIDPPLPRFVCHFQFNEFGTKYSFPFYAPEVPSVGPNAFWTHIPFESFSRLWKLIKTNISIQASIESFDINVEIECGMRLVKEDDLPVLAKVISDISPCALDFETCKDLLEQPCRVCSFKLENESSEGLD